MFKKGNEQVTPLEVPHEQKGFILITSIILLAILMGLGAAAMFKTQVEIKVSSGSVQSTKAFAAAQAGLDYTFYYWDQDVNGVGAAEFTALNTAAKGGASNALLVNLAPTTLDELGVSAAAIDTYVQSNTPLRVYNLDGGMTETVNANWNANNYDSYAQVAIWTTIYEPYTFPYARPKGTTGCSNCVFVLYALGRSGDSYKLMREFTAVEDNNVQAFGAMMNAPRYANDTDGCGTPPPAPSGAVSIANGAPSGSAITGSHLIDATQAPGGIGIASNNGVDFNASKQFYSTTGSSFQDIDPYIVFDPGKVAANANTYPKIEGGLTSAVTSAVSSGRFDPYADSYMNYFNSDSDQLFQLNAYREAANRISGFANETLYGTFPDGSTSYVVDSYGTTLGNYNAALPTMGTMQWADVKANINASRPMYGLLRLMVPVVDSGSKIAICSPSPANDTILFDRGTGFTNSLAGGTGKLIVYGGAMFDFFYDGYTGIDASNVANGTYEPNKDRLLTPLESSQDSFKMNVDIPLMFNPVMDTPPRTGSAAISTFPGTAILDIYAYPDGSPSWDLASDANVGDGVMDYIQDINTVATDWSNRVYGGGALKFISYADWITNNKPTAIGGAYPAGREAEMLDMLDYYIRTTSEGTKTDWSHRQITGASGIETNKATFKIKTSNDLVDTASSADLFHSFAPSGYIHGWKRAMVETGLAVQSGATGKSKWNEELIGATSKYYATRNEYFNLTGYVGGPDGAKVDKDFADIPAEMYAGGLVDMHQIVNTSGVVYTPGQLELEQKKKNGFQALQYINGVIITGHGTFMKQEGAASNALTIISYDDTSIDNLPSNQPTLTLKRKYWQELK
ncbi:MAG: pilus assembly PilX N-terminal domain-containing protein [Ghiorsea sp.]